MTVETARDILRRRANGDSYRQIAMHVGVSKSACLNVCQDPLHYPVEPYRCECGELATSIRCSFCWHKKSVH